MKGVALAALEYRSPLLDRGFRRRVRKQFGEASLPANALLEPSWLETQVRIPAHLPLCVAYERRPNLRIPAPHPLFDTRWYLEQNPEASNHSLGSLGHYLQHGEDEGLLPSPWWSQEKGPLREAITNANELLATSENAIRASVLDGHRLTVLFWEDASDALAQAKALSTCGWQGEIAVVFSQSHFAQKPDKVVTHDFDRGPDVKRLSKTRRLTLQPAERVQLAAAVALLNDMSTSWVFDPAELNDIALKSSASASRWICTLMGAPTPALIAQAQALMNNNARLPTSAVLNLTEPRSGDRDVQGWGELLMFWSSSSIQIASPSKFMRFALSQAAAAVPVVTGMEAGDEYASPPPQAIARISQRAESLRWCLRTPVTSPLAKANWGDTWFAQDLADALRQLGQFVTIDSQSSLSRFTSNLTDVNLILQGKQVGQTFDAGLNLVWVISNPDLVDVALLRRFDAVFVASHMFNRSLRAQGVDSELLLQATNPRRFHPLTHSELTAHIDSTLLQRLGQCALFVGGAREGSRPIVTDAVICGLPLMIYGHGWGGLPDSAILMGSHLPNDDLNAYYQAAKVVLADHEESMRVNGFISNRIFDAAASGARVVCDEPVGDPYHLEDVFGTNVRPYHTQAQLRGLLLDPISAWPEDQLRRANASIIGETNSFEERARSLIDKVMRLRVT